MKEYLRSFQTLFPYLQDARFYLTSCIMKVVKHPYEKDFLLLEKFRPLHDQVLIDVGSNRGLAIIAMIMFPHMKNLIIGFEPNSLVFKKLKNNIFIRNNKRIVLYPCGLSNQNEVRPLYLPFYRKWMFDGLASLNFESASKWLVYRLWHFNQNKLKIEQVNCEVRKLDDFGYNPYFIKIDVQGHELQVLKGAENTLAKYRPILLIEAINEQIIQFLSRFDYSFYHFQKGTLFEGTGEINTFCLTEEKYLEITGSTKACNETAKEKYPVPDFENAFLEP